MMSLTERKKLSSIRWIMMSLKVTPCNFLNFLNFFLVMF